MIRRTRPYEEERTANLTHAPIHVTELYQVCQLRLGPVDPQMN